MKKPSKNIEAIYPLSPMQSGMLFHALLAPEEMAYFQQIHWTYAGPLNPGALRQAWDMIVARHAILRTGFVWDKHKEPLQVVRLKVELPWTYLDYSDLSPEEQAKRFEAFLVEDKQQHFPLQKAPLMRCALIRMGEEEHRFVWTHHHLLLDGWSYSNMLGELFSAYGELCQGREPQLRPPVPFRNYIGWLKKQDAKAAQNYWRNRLKGFIAPNPLGLDRDFDTDDKYGFHRLVISEEVTAQLREAAHSQHLTLTTLVHAAWGLMLHTYSGQWDIVFGSLVSGRSTSIPGVESIVGMMINTLPLRMIMQPHMPLNVCLQQLQQQMAECDTYSYSALVEIQAESDVPTGTSLFETVLVFENYPFDESLEKRDEALKIRDVHMFGPTNYPLTAEVDPGKELIFALKYDGEKFDAPTILRIASHLEQLLLAMKDGFNAPIHQISALGDEERKTLLHTFNQTQRPFPSTSNFAQLLAEQTLRTPNTLAASDHTERANYAELQACALTTAAKLRAHGIGPETVTALFAERSLNFLHAILGAFHAGGAYLPLDINHPPHRIAQVISLAAPRLVLTSRELKSVMDDALATMDVEARPQTLVLEDLLAEEATPLSEPVVTDPTNLAYIIYTSGSTGLPKGAMVHQSGMINHLCAKVDHLELVAEDRVAQNAPQCFDISVWQFLCGLLVGAETRIFNDETSRDPAQLMARAQDLTILEVVPSMLRAMLEEIDQNRETYPFSNLRWLMLTGEALPPELSREWLARYPQIPIVNAYGPTECSDDVTHHNIVEQPGPKVLITPIGKTIDNTQLYVVDQHGHPLPLGVAGEMWVGGAGVGRGYLGDPTRTAAVFIPNPFAEEPGQRLYRSGDLVRHCLPESGDLSAMPPFEFLGRIDFQVKIRGFRIEIGEIESVLQEQPEVAQTVVTVWEDPRGDKKLIAYIVADVGNVPTIRDAAKARLPEYMVPSQFVAMDALPLTPNGKVDRKSLPEPDENVTDVHFVAPRNPIEQTVADIWSETLGVDRVGVGANFFELGGHSLIATRVIVRIRALLDVELPLRDLFEAPVLEDLAAKLVALRRGEATALPPIPVTDRTDNLPLSFAQQRIWFLDELEGPSAIYNMPSILRLEGALHIPVLERTLTAIVARHHSLRTSFGAVEGRDYQKINPAYRVKIPIMDLSLMEEATREQKVKEMCQEEAKKPFILGEDPMLRLQLLVLAENKYVLLATMHHIISDDWSIGVFIEELVAHYTHFKKAAETLEAEGKFSEEALDQVASPLPELAIQYPDFAVWQKDWLSGDTLAEQFAYWKEQLAGIPELLELPTDLPRPATQSYRGAMFDFTLPPALFAEVTKLNRKTGTTPFMVLISVYALMLARYSGQDDVCIGTPVANRGRGELESLIGFFINTLVIRARMHGNPSILDLISSVREASLGAYTHQDIPFEKLVDELQPERHLSHSPVFQAMFVLQNAPMGTLEVPGLTITGDEVSSGTAKFDINLLMIQVDTPEGPTLKGTFEYATDLFHQSTIERMKQHFISLLTAATQKPEESCFQLPMLDPAERQNMLAGFNNTYDATPTVAPHVMMEATVERTPDAIAAVMISENTEIAIDDSSRQMTYAQLNKAANQLAHYLAQKGVRQGDRVGISIERSFDMVVGVLAILKAGATLVPLDPAYPEVRLTYMVQNTGCKILLTLKGMETNLKEGLIEAIYLNEQTEEIAACPSHNPGIEPQLEDLFFVIHTSGSTGMPKSVALSQRAMGNLTAWRLKTMVPGHGTLQFASLSFDASFYEIFGAWGEGDTLYLIPEDLRFDAMGLLAQVARYGVSKVILPVVVLQLWAESFEEHPELFQHFREIITTGEQLQVTQSVVSMFQQLPQCTLHNHYGPSETHVITAYSFNNEPDTWSFHAPIGVPITNCTCYILDDFMQPVPVGVIGSLYLGGVNVARGYLNRGALTAEKFVPDPFGSQGQRLYNTGDLARYFPDGIMEFLGRRDHQVKLRGFRIEMGEIESALQEYEDVNETVVICREERGEKILVAFAVPVEGATLNNTALRAHLKDRLPDYMVPAHFVTLDALPLNPNGKIDRKALPDHDKTGDSDNFVAPRSVHEKTIAQIWEDILGLEKVGIYDNFFEIGGHSLTATQVVARVRNMLQVELQLREIFAHPVLVDLSERIQVLRNEGNTPPAPMVPVSRDQKLPLAFSQKRLWFLDQLEPDSPSFNITRPLGMHGPLIVEGLEYAMRKELERHEITRTIYKSDESGPYQEVIEDMPFDLWVVDYSEACEDPLETAMQLSFEHGRKAFNLSKAPLVCLTVLRLGPEHHIALIKLHHILSDGWSRGVLVRDFREFYTAYVEQREPNIEPLPIQFADYAVWQHNRNHVIQNQLKYWTDVLEDLPTLELATDKPRPPVFRSVGYTHHFDLEPAFFDRIAAFSLEHAVTPYMVTLAALKILLARYSGQQDIVVGTPIANRTYEEIKDMIGFFLNIQGIRTNQSGGPTYLDFLNQVREAALAAYDNQEIPFDTVVETVNPKRDLSRHPIFQVFFHYDHGYPDQLGLPGVGFNSPGLDNDTAKFDLMLALGEEDGGLHGFLEYSTDLFEQPTMDRFVEQFRLLLDDLLENPHKPIDQLNVLSEDSRNYLVSTLSNSQPTIESPTVQDWLAKAVAQHGDAVAVSAETGHRANLPIGATAGQLTYRELDEAANALAHALRAQGVGADQLVGLCLERGTGMIVSILGVLKAGAAYLPIDPEYPSDRIAFMLSDAQVPLLIVDNAIDGDLPPFSGQTWNLHQSWSAIQAQPKTAPNIAVHPAHLCYVIYTSGSSGRPKGVGVNHQGLSAYLGWAMEAYGPESGDGVPMHGSLAFDATVTSLFPPLLAGKTIYLVADTTDMSGLGQTLTEGPLHGLVKLTPAHLEILLRTLPAGSIRAKTLVVGGEALPPQTVAQWYQKHPQTTLINEYGPTETVVGCTTFQVPQDWDGVGSVPIGTPIAGAQVYVLDHHMQPSPLGVPGELYLGGPALARGYLNRPGLTAEKFVPHPFDDTPGARLYRTGDLVRFKTQAEGEPLLDFIGRIDGQVKLRGYRIELGEIEALLDAHEAVAESLVIIREDTPGDQRLAAYIVPNSPWSPQQLQEALKPHLPAYMVPGAFVELASIPLTVNGKVDRAALPVPQAASSEAYSAPRTPIEEAITNVWAELLKAEQVGLDDNFFELGGHSLLATQVGARLSTIFGAELPVRAIFEGPTPRELARFVESSAQETPVPPIHPTRRDGQPLPLSFGQSRLWFLDNLNPGGTEYNVPIALRLEGAIGAGLMEQVVEEMLNRHETLRTVFVGGENEEPQQVIQPPTKLHLPLIDFSHLPETAREAAVMVVAQQEMARPFDLSEGPLLRVLLLRESAQSHVLLACMHHIISDGWSMGVFVREWVTLYQAALDQIPSPLQPLHLQYADYAKWQRDWLQGEVLQSQLAFWSKHLDGAPDLLELPTDRPRGAVQSFAGATQDFHITPELGEQLHTLARGADATPFMVLISAYATLLSKYSQQQDVVIGTPIANRHHPGLEPLIGFFVNTLALRVDLNEDPNFHSLLKRVRTGALEAYAHQDLPFEKLVEELQPRRSLSHTPIFQTMFSLQNASDAHLELPGLNVKPVDADRDVAQFDLTLAVSEEAGGYRGIWEYNTDLFDAPTLTTLSQHFTQLLTGIVAQPDAPLRKLSLLGDEVRTMLLESWNNTSAELGQQPSLCHLFANRAHRTPHEPAVIEGSTINTYSMLAEQVQQIAAHLHQRGVTRGDVVATCFNHGSNAIAGLLAVLTTGAAYLPLDPSYPQERLEMMVADSGAKLLLTQEALADSIAVDLPTRLNLEDVGPANQVQFASVVAEQPAYIIYTSGSTGTPKGVVVHHGAVVNHALAIGKRFALCAADRILQFAALGFDVAAEEIFATLAAGASIIPRPADIATSFEAFGQLLHDQQISVVNLPSPYWHGWIEELEASEASLPQSLRLVVVGSDRVAADAPSRWSKLTNLPWMNAYGTTETTITTTVYSDGSIAGEPPIGKPLANTTAWVMDREGIPVPSPVSGELCIGGAGVAMGYLNQPALTAAKFVPDPYGEPGSRLYRTGDRARFLPDGNIVFGGRLDTQFKLRGFRIEPGEIEAALKAFTTISDATVLLREDQVGNPQLVAYVVDTAQDQEAPLRDFLQSRLPAYMLPTHIVNLTEMPLTPNGKVDVKALPQPEQSDDRYVAPQTATEIAVAQAFAQVLDLPKVGLEDDFFQLGGHSLLATRLLGRIRAAFSVNLPVRILFEAPTVAALARQVEARTGEDQVIIPELAPVPRTEDMPLSFAQSRLWFLDQLHPGGHEYNMPVALRLHGPMNPSTLEDVVNMMVARHETLRTVFPKRGDHPIQHILQELKISVPIQNLDTVPETDREARIEAIAKEELTRPFNLAEGPLLRAMILRENENSHVLLACMHHIISDGWSMGIFVREWVELYTQQVGGSNAQLETLPVQYADYASWQRSWLVGQNLETQVDFWRKQLDGAPELLELPTDFPRGTNRTFAGDSLSFDVDTTVGQQLAALTRDTNATSFMTLLTAYAVLLGRYSHQRDVVIGTPIANRRDPSLEGLIGFFANTLVLRVNMEDNPSFKQLLARVRQHALEAYAHQDVPFEKLVEVLQPKRELSHTPLFQVMFSMQNTGDAELSLPGLQAEWLGFDRGATQFDMTLDVSESGEGGLSATLEFATDLFEKATAERFAAQYQRLLQQIVAHPELPIDQLDILSDNERDQMLVQFNETALETGEVLGLEDYVASFARSEPGRLALCDALETLTYEDLDRRSGLLAYELHQRGMGPDQLVGLHMERTNMLGVALLAVLKCGAAFLPLDPTLPEGRLHYIAENAGASLILSNAPALDWHTPQLDLRNWVPAGDMVKDKSNTVQPNHLAYVIYTSGSTGLPKGVAITRANWHNLISYQHTLEAFDADSHVLQFASIGFDASIWEYGAFAVGACLYMISDTVQKSPDLLYDFIKENRISYSILPPSLLAVLRDADTLPDLKLLGSGGEACSSEVVRKWGSNRTFYNAYGPTEATVASTIAFNIDADHVPPIGQPLANTQTYLLDHNALPVPMGAGGELFIGGAGLARGYVGKPALTAEKFVPNPFATTPGERLYRTGDLVRFSKYQNALMFQGRIDNQVKLRGFRVELGEIENCLLSSPLVAAAVVIVRDTALGKQLVAYVQPKETGTDITRDLQNFLGQHLPGYMVPGLFVSLDQMPMTASQKIDRKALPEAQEPTSLTSRPPANQREAQVVAVWEEVLGRTGIGAEDDFFQIGGHSLLAVHLMARLQDVSGIQLPLSSLFTAPTPAGLAHLLDGQQTLQTTSQIVPLRESGEGTPFFAVHPVGGNVFAYTTLTHQIQRPLYGIQAQGLIHNEPLSATTMETMAQSYIQAMREVQPQGPYHLGGWSMGGVVAFEMARQLVAAGEEVASLILIDSYAEAVHQMDETETFASFCGDLLSQSGIHPKQVEDALSGWKEERDRVTQVWEAAQKLGMRHMDKAQMQRLWEIYRENTRTLAGYQPGTYAGKVHLFQAVAGDAPDHGWQSIATNLEHHSIDADHYNILAKAAEAIGRIV